MSVHRRVKMSDVAARAGVSVATVSKVVNGRYGVSAQTTMLVQDVIAELGYVGNLSAAGLRAAQTNILGILVAEFEPFSAEIIKGAALATRGTAYELLSYAGGEQNGWEERSIARFGGTIIDGAVVVTPTSASSKFIVPVVAIDPHYGPHHLPTVDADSFGGAYRATKYLIELGHRGIAFLGGRGDLDSSRQREAGFRQAVNDHGISLPPSYVQDTGYDVDVARTVAHQLLSDSNRPSAIFAANDVTALEVVGVAQELGIKVPAELSVVGFDDIPLASLSEPGLTTVRQPLGEMGRVAMEKLIRLLRGEDIVAHQRMETELVIRGSSAPPHSDWASG